MRWGLSKKERLAVFQPEFIEDLRYWVETDRKLALRAFDLSEAILRDPFDGIGKPEPLKYLAPGVWSRRLTQEQRIVYLVRAERIDFLQARKEGHTCDDIPPELRAWVKQVAEAQHVPASQVAALALLRLAKEWQAGQIDLTPYKVESHSPRFEWNLALKLEDFGVGQGKPAKRRE